MTFIDPDMPQEIHDAVANITAFEVCNIQRYERAKVFPSPYPHRSAFNLRVKQKPSFDLFHAVPAQPLHKWDRAKEYFVSRCEKTGFFNSYTHSPGTRDGFAGAKIELWFPGGGENGAFSQLGRHKKVFEGSLWDTVEAKRAADTYFGVTTTSVAFCEGRNGCPISAEIDVRIFNAILRMAGLERLLHEEDRSKPALSNGKK